MKQANQFPQLFGEILFSGAVRVGYIDKEILINPTRKQLKNSLLDLVVVGSADGHIGN